MNTLFVPAISGHRRQGPRRKAASEIPQNRVFPFDTQRFNCAQGNHSAHHRHFDFERVSPALQGAQ